MIKIDKDSFLKAIKPLMNGLPDKAITGAEDLIQATVTKTGTMTLIISNFKCEMVNVCPCVSKEDCSFTVDAKLLYNSIISVPDGEVKIKIIINEQTNHAASIAISAVGTTRKYKIVCPDSDGFYSWSGEDKSFFEFSMPVRDLNEKLKIAASNVDKKDITEAFCNISVFPDKDGKMMFATGNASMLCFIKTDIDTDQKFILPSYIAKYISSFTEIDQCYVSITDKRFCFKYGDFSVKTSLVNGGVPNYPGLLTQFNPEKSIVVSKNAFTESLRVHSAYTDAISAVRMTCDGSSEMSVQSGDKGSNEVFETLEVLNEQNCDFRIAVNCNFLRMATSAIKDERVRIATSGVETNTPLFVSSENENGDLLWMVGRLKV